MACWRVLELSEQPYGEQIAQLLVKPVFTSDSYTVHLTDLSNIWSEELDLDGIIDRASQEQSPIEVGKQDTAQLPILLDNVKKALGSSQDTTCRITRNGGDDVTLHTNVSLPKPLDSLAWKFYLEKRPSTTLKNELILPLLVSSHIQYERINGLISTIADKDRAITRLMDQFESSNLDLAAAFPSVGGFKAGRKMIKREQATRQVPALQPFREEAWREETGQLKVSDVTTLGLFQEALAQSTPMVPTQLKSEDLTNSWWTAIPNRLSQNKVAAKYEVKKPPVAELKDAGVESSGDETEDEFETHENFKTRNISSKPAELPVLTSPSAQNGLGRSEDESTEDGDDLDAPPKSQSQSQGRTPRKPLSRARLSMPEASPPLEPHTPPATKSKAKGFRIGGKVRKAATESPPPPQGNTNVSPDARTLPTNEAVRPSSQVDEEANVTPKKPRRPFKIGGKGKAAAGSDGRQRDVPASPKTDSTRTVRSRTDDSPSFPPPRNASNEETPAEEIHGETPEEKAERKRAELKRKIEEASKKQAQYKKKKRF